jgi:amidohydrolase
MPDLADRIAEALPRIVSLRRDLHSCPELGYEEHETSARVQLELSRSQIDFQAELAGGTGVLAFLPSTRGGDARTIALRADMDALPIQEQTGKPYRSRMDGKMHACGHDGHTAILVGTAQVLAQVEDRPNHVLFLFQPAEEGGAGGRRMVEDGALDGSRFPRPEYIFGLHGDPILKVGNVNTRVGSMMAAADTFQIQILGKGAHAAAPHTGVDPVVVAAHIVTALQTISSRGVDPLDSVVVSVTMAQAGTAHNIIPEACCLKGTIRTLQPETRSFAHRRVREIAERVAAAFGASAVVEVMDGYPVTRNDAEAVQRFKQTVGTEMPGALESDPLPVMGAEDFSFYGEHAKACFFWLGLAPGEPLPNLHSPYFDFNDDALPVGMEAMARLALAP